MIHYHGLPITPITAATQAIEGGHAFVSFEYPEQLELAMEICQTFAVDNGAFSRWKSGFPVLDWTPYYEWVRDIRTHPAFEFAVIPDVIDGDEEANDKLLSEWTFPPHESAVVWHLHESMDRLERLLAWPRIALGSSGDFSSIGTEQWWEKINEAMKVICDSSGRPRVKIHGLRMLDPEVFTKIPFSSADSTNIARNIGIDSRWNQAYTPSGKDARARVIRERIEAFQSPGKWNHRLSQTPLF